MRRFLIGLTIFACIVGFFGILQYNESIYTRDCVVVDQNEQSTVYEDSQGNLWETLDYYKGHKGDKVTLKMHDNHTSGYIYDDIILEVK